MCHSRRYALGRGTGAALVNRAIVLRTTIATTQADTPQYRYANTPHRTCILRLLLIVERLTTQSERSPNRDPVHILSERSPNRDFILDKTQYFFIFCPLLPLNTVSYVTGGAYTPLFHKVSYDVS